MFDPNRPAPAPGTVQTMGAPAMGQRPGMPQGGYGAPGGIMQALNGRQPPMGGGQGGISLGGFPAMPPTGVPGVPGAVPPMGGQPAFPNVNPGAMPPVQQLDPATGGIGGGAGFQHLLNNPNIPPQLLEFLTALQGWRQTRPEGGDHAARQAWRATMPSYGGAFVRSGAPGVPGDPGATATNLPGAAAQGAAGTYGTQLGVIGQTPPTDPFGLPTY